MCNTLFLHFSSHIIDWCLSLIVHDSIVKHDQNISLELICSTNFASFYILLYGLKIKRPKIIKTNLSNEMYLRSLVTHQNHGTYLRIIELYSGAMSSVIGLKNMDAFLCWAMRLYTNIIDFFHALCSFSSSILILVAAGLFGTESELAMLSRA